VCLFSVKARWFAAPAVMNCRTGNASPSSMIGGIMIAFRETSFPEK